MISPEIIVLIPCHSLEDFPTEQSDEPAASLLNSFSVAFHPALLAWTSDFPRWHRADDPPPTRRGQLIFVPTVSDDWLPHSWADGARQSGAVVISGMFERQEMIFAALKVLDVNLSLDTSNEDAKADDVTSSQSGSEVPPSPEGELNDDESKYVIDEELVADFLALGTCWLLIELLTRRMRQYGNIDEMRFFQRVQLAAKAAIADDKDTAATHLRGCFEMLLEARERFYPVDCYLLDLCLAVPEVDFEKLLPETQQSVPWSLVVNSDDLSAICEKCPELGPALSEACGAGRVSLVGGEDRETPLPILPLESVLYHFQRGRREFARLTGRHPDVWGRRRFGLTALLPQLLVKFGYKAALHVVLDDGIYPDAEYTKLRWRGVDGTLIDALSRIPLAADAAASYLRFPVRMAESMDHDQVSGLILARWPTVEGPWFDDLRRSQKYAPCLGRFVALDRFFEQTELPGQLSTHKPGEYFSPQLIQHVARAEARPIGRYADRARLRRRLDTAISCHSIAQVLMMRPLDSTIWLSVEDALELADPTSDLQAESMLTAGLDEFESKAKLELSGIIMHAASPGRGVLVMNPLSFARRVVVPLPDQSHLPVIGGSVKAVQYSAGQPGRTACVVEVPGCGYTWISCHTAAELPAKPKLNLAESGLLRNDLFEVAINVRTGGIGHIRFHNQRSKRLSQQLSFRFPRERTISSGSGSTDTIKSQYAEMRCHGQEVTCNGTACGEIQTWGEVVDQVSNDKLASFRQTFRVWRGLPTVEIEIELSDVKIPDGDPWNNYFASRFAWNDSTAAVTRSIYHSAHGFSGERFETSDYLEIASDDERLTIVPHGLPFHRKTGDRMIDSLLIVAGDHEHRFRFTVSVDTPFPLEAAWNALAPAYVVPTEFGQPRSGATGWFFHLDSRHVQISRLIAASDVAGARSPLEHCETSSIPADPGFALRLIESEGRQKPVKLRCFRTPTFARKRDFRGEAISELIIQGDAVLIDMTAFEIVDVELRFGAP